MPQRHPHFPDVEVDDLPPAPIGHNAPPPDEQARADFDEALRQANSAFLEKLADLEGAAERVRVHNDETLGRAGDLDATLRDALKLVTTVHKDVKEPYLRAGRAVDAKKNALTDRIEGARRHVRDRSNAYLNEREAARRAEEARIAAEQRRLAAEAQAAQDLRDEAAARDDAESMADVPVIAAPAPSAPAPSKVKSDTGVTVSGRTVTRSQVDDYVAAFDAVKSNPKVREAIEKAIAQLVKAGMREIPGVRVWDEQQMQTRG